MTILYLLSTHINKAMQADHGSLLTQKNQQKVNQFFTNKKLSMYLQQQIKELQQQFSDGYQFLVTVEDTHLFIYFHKNGRCKGDENNQQISSSQPIEQSFNYLIRISKGFPVSGVRLHLLKSYNLWPHIHDCRDLLYEVLGDKWSHQRKLSQIIERIDYFEEKLVCRNQNYLGMQRTGQFQLGDLYHPLQLTKFESMEIFEDFSVGSEKKMVATTSTHLIVFKLAQQQKYHGKYYLSTVCEIQCISQINKSQIDDQLRLTILKYRKIKNFFQYDKVELSFIVQNRENLIRNILKEITKFQKIELGLQLSSRWKQQQNFESIGGKIKQCEELEDVVAKLRGEEQQIGLKKLNKNYQKIIEYFSARANCYYLIYVNKLNNLFSDGKERRVGGRR